MCIRDSLNCKIDSSPPFPGKERHLLRETIARIAHGTEICPKDMYVADEDEGKEGQFKLADEFAFPATAALNEVGAWVHKQPHLLMAGRCTHYIPPDMAEDEDFKAKLEETDKPQERFRELGGEEYAEMAALKETPQQFGWAAKICGD